MLSIVVQMILVRRLFRVVLFTLLFVQLTGMVQLSSPYLKREQAFASPDGESTITYSDDFTVDSAMWTYEGSAYRDDAEGYVVLTMNSGYQAGAIWFNQSFTSNFTASFRYKVGGGSGGDGFVAMFCKQYSNTLSTGGSLDFSGSGYGVEFDIFQNSYDPSPTHIALIRDDYRNHLVNVSDVRAGDNQWHSVAISVMADSITVYLDTDKVIQWNGIPDRTYGRLGFAGATGSINNWHIIDDFSLTLPSPTPSPTPIPTTTTTTTTATTTTTTTTLATTSTTVAVTTTIPDNTVLYVAGGALALIVVAIVGAVLWRRRRK